MNTDIKQQENIQIETSEKLLLEADSSKTKLKKKRIKITSLVLAVLVLAGAAGYYFQTEYGIFYGKEKRKEVSFSLAGEAEKLINQADFPTTEKTAKRAVRHYPANIEAHLLWARSLYAQERLAESRDVYLKGLAIEPENFKMNFYLGNVYRDLGELEKAEEQYLKALAIEPANIECWINYAIFYSYDREDLEGAVRVYEQALKVNPGNERLQTLYQSSKERLEEGME